MTTITVWLLISISSSNANSSGTLTVVGKFPDAAQCSHVKRSIDELSQRISTRCIQAVIVKE